MHLIDIITDNDKNNVNSKPLNVICGGLFILLGLVAAVVMRNWGTISHDEAYQTWAVLNWQDMRTAPLSFWIGAKWLEVTGINMLNLRLLARIIAIVSVAVTCLYLFLRTRRGVLSCFVFMVCMWVWRSDAFMIYNWDSGSYLWDVLALISIVEYFRSPSVNKALLTGGACALMTLGRMPSGVIVIAWAILSFLYGRENKLGFKHFLTTLSAFGLAFLAVFTIILWSTYSNPIEYFSTLNKGVVGGHSLSNLDNYKFRLIFMSRYFTFLYFPALLCLLTCWVCRKRFFISSGLTHVKRHIGVILTLFIICVFVAFWEVKFHNDDSAECFMGCAVPIVVGFLLLVPLRNFSFPGAEKIRISKWQMWGCAIVIFSMLFGSDAYTERIEGGIVLPVIILILWATENHAVQRYVLLVTGVWLFCCVGMNVSHWANQRRYCTYLYDNSNPVIADIYGEYDIQGICKSLSPGVEKIKNADEKYILLEDENQNRTLFGLLLGADNGPGYNDFQFASTSMNSWTPEKVALLNETDALLFRRESMESDYELQSVVRLMQEKGFTYQEEVGDCIILRKNRSGQKIR